MNMATLQLFTSGLVLKASVTHFVPVKKLQICKDCHLKVVSLNQNTVHS